MSDSLGHLKVSEEEIRYIIDHCKAIAEDYPEPWGPLVFNNLLRLALGPTATPQEASRSKNESDVGRSGHGIASKLETGITRLASALGLTSEEVLKVYAFGQDGVVIQEYDLSSSRPLSQSAREIAGLQLIARNLVYSESEVDLNELRAACDTWGVLDPSNFAYNHIGKSSWFTKRGSKVRLSATARPHLAEAAQRIVACLDSSAAHEAPPGQS